MAASCCSSALLSFQPTRPRYRIVSSNSVGQKCLDLRFRLLLRTQKRLGGRKAASGLCVSSLGETKVATVTSESWDKLVLESDTPVLVEIHVSWCGPCDMVHRVIDELARDYSGKVKCFVLDADKYSMVAENYDITSVPVVLLFKDGKKVESIVGTMPRESYAAAIDRALA